MVAVFGIMRFRRGYIDRPSTKSRALDSKLANGDDDQAQSEEQLQAVLPEAEANGVALAVLGTLVNGLSGLLGHWPQWAN